MMKRIGCYAAALILSFAVIARAADPSPSPPAALSLNDCLKIALGNQVDVLTGLNAVISAKAGETKAKSSYFPQAVSQRFGTHVDTNAPGSATTSTGDSASLTVTQNIYDGGLRENGVTGARAAEAQSEYALERTRQTTVFNVTSGFFALLRAKSLEAVQDQQVKYLQEQLDQVNARVKLGTAAEVDSLPIEASLATAQYTQLSAENNTKTAAVQLQAAMGLAPQADFDIVESEVPDQEIQPVDSYMIAALAARPEISKAEAAITQERSALKSARIVLYPQPTINAEYDKSLMEGSYHDLILNGGFTFDVFDGGSNRAAYRIARAGLSNAEITAAQAAKDVQSDVQQAYLNLVSSKEQMNAGDVSLKAAQKNFDVQEARYKQGLAIPLDLLNAQVQLVTAQSNLAQSKYAYYTSLAQLEYATGAWGGLK